ncbi:Pyridoxal phosphate-dependent transferase [Rhypophila decipiens]
MAAFNLQTCARPNILTLQPYVCARDDYKDDGTNTLLDANENAYGPPIAPEVATSAEAAGPGIDLLGLHRYPDPHQIELKQALCNLRNTHLHTPKLLTPQNVSLGVGSDESIDAMLRCFCRPSIDRILVCPPTYGMYSVSAHINDVGLVKIPLLPAPGFQIDVSAVLDALTNEPNIKLVYLTSPGNPTGSSLSKDDIQKLLTHPTWNGVVIIDEAYVDFASPSSPSLAEWVTEWPNLVVMQTLSKGFGLAGIRLGAIFTSPEIALLLNSLQAPYNIPSPTAALATYALSDKGLGIMRQNVENLLKQRERMIKAMEKIPGVGRLRGGLDSNFLLYEMLNKEGQPDNKTALAVYERLAEQKGVVVRFRGKEHGCEGCLRITVGTGEETGKFLEAVEKTLAEVRG